MSDFDSIVPAEKKKFRFIARQCRLESSLFKAGKEKMRCLPGRCSGRLDTDSERRTERVPFIEPPPLRNGNVVVAFVDTRCDLADSDRSLRARLDCDAKIDPLRGSILCTKFLMHRGKHPLHHGPGVDSARFA